MFESGSASHHITQFLDGFGQPALASETELLDGARVLRQIRRLLDAVESGWLAELNRQAVCEHQFGMTTHGWAAWDSNTAPAEASRRTRVGNVLDTSFPTVAAAMADGRLSFEHAVVLCRLANPRVINQLSRMEGELVDLAVAAPFDRYVIELKGIVDRLDADGGHDPTERPSELRLAPTLGGTNISGFLTGEDDLVVNQLLGAEADRLYREQRHDTQKSSDVPHLSRAQLQAQALVELCRRAAGAQTSAHPGATPAAEVILHIHADHPEAVTDHHGVTLSNRAVARLCCDPVLHPIILDYRGLPLDAGRATRLVTPAQRRALRARDRGCRFPGCHAHVNWCDAHHIIHWRHGGPTDLPNLVLLCRRHHGITHRAGWRLTASDDGLLTWTTPNGHTLTSPLPAATGPP